MEYRKLISFGKSSYVVSLPKQWVTYHKLKKGDLIYFDEIANNLLLQPRLNTETATEDKEITVTVDRKDMRRIQREAISAYLQNNKTIIFIGDEIKEKAPEIQQFIQNLVALEVLEQDSKKIIAKDFLNIKDISVEQIIRKMDVIARSMLKDSKTMFQKDIYDNIYHRDTDVNKFRFLIYRIIWYGLENPAKVSKLLNLNQKDLFVYWWLSFSLEGIADHIKRIARHMRETKLPAKEQVEFIKLLDNIEEMYVNIMKAYYTSNIEAAHNVVQGRFEIIQQCDDFYRLNSKVDHIGNLIYNTKSLIVTIHSIGRIVYQGMPG